MRRVLQDLQAAGYTQETILAWSARECWDRWLACLGLDQWASALHEAHNAIFGCLTEE